MNRQQGIQWLYGELPTLLSEGVLSAETATRLQQYYGTVQVRSRRALVLLVWGWRCWKSRTLPGNRCGSFCSMRLGRDKRPGLRCRQVATKRGIQPHSSHASYPDSPCAVCQRVYVVASTSVVADYSDVVNSAIELPF